MPKLDAEHDVKMTNGQKKATKTINPVKTTQVTTSATGFWVERSISVLGINGHRPIIQAQKLGSVAVHRSLDRLDMWAVTLTESGVCAAQVMTEDDARKIACLLNLRCSGEVRCDSANALSKKLPRWALDWLKACEKAMAYIQPKTAGAKN